MKPFSALLAAASALAATSFLAAPAMAQVAAGQEFRESSPEKEVVYFVLPDRFANGDLSNDKGGLKGGPLQHGFDPANKGFYHGGDLKGLTAKLDYIQNLGATAIWFAPVFKNKPVQGKPGQEDAGYHGYWVTDFTRIDPHFGTNDEFKAFVEAAHSRGMKVYMDIITNHTADVIRYAEGDAAGYVYRSKADYPFSRKGGVYGAAINDGFKGDGDPSPANWARMTDPSFAYTPYVPEAEKNVKVPAWLNDPIYYHNRGDTFWKGESSLYGDFVGLDDLATENPRVLQGFIEIYGSWIDRFGIDGFRIDTAKHVNPEFWQGFVPAMLERARAKGIPNFHMFGEVNYQSPDAVLSAQFMEDSGLPSTLDMGFASAVTLAVSGKGGTEVVSSLMAQDNLYPGGGKTALQLPTFLGNHDFGRFSMFMKRANPEADEGELLQRVMLGHAMMFGLRGVPVVYYGDEQGFVSDDNDQLAREDMFASKVALYNDNDLLGTDATTAQNNFDTGHPLYRLISQLSTVRLATPALTDGRTLTRYSADTPGLLAISRFDPDTGKEVLLLFNTSPEPLRQNVSVDVSSLSFQALVGNCTTKASAPGSVVAELPPFGFAFCAAQ